MTGLPPRSSGRARSRAGLWLGTLALGAALAACQDMPQRNIAEAVDQSLRQGGASAAAAGGWQEAAASYRTLYQRNAADPTAALGLVRSLRNTGQAEEAARIGAAAVTRHPDNPALLAEYGKARLAAGDVAGALETLSTAAGRAPGEWSVHSALGVARDLNGDHRGAQEAYRAALDLAPGNPALLNNFALSLALSGDLDGGIAQLENTRLRGTAQTRQSLALLYALKGDATRSAALVRRDLPERQAAENLAFLRQLETAAPQTIERLSSATRGPASAPDTFAFSGSAAPRAGEIAAAALPPGGPELLDDPAPVPAPAPRKARRRAAAAPETVVATSTASAATADVPSPGTTPVPAPPAAAEAPEPAVKTEANAATEAPAPKAAEAAAPASPAAQPPSVGPHEASQG